MPRNLDAVPITLETILQVFPLARSLIAGLEQEAWLAFARRHIERAAGGIVGVQDERGYFHALFGYEIRPDATGWPTLDVGFATAVDLLDPTGAVAVLGRGIEAVAVEQGCAAAHVRLRAEQRRLRRWLERDGYALQGVTLQKPIAAARQ